MKIGVFGNEDLFDELSASKDAVEWVLIKDEQNLINETAQAFFILQDELPFNVYSIGKPVFWGSNIKTLAQVAATNNIVRFNAWPTFVSRNVWEVAGNIDDAANTVLLALNKEAVKCADVVGFPAARVVAMVANEAFFAMDDKVSTDEEIDIAMKLGTNYPNGPFGWTNKIGGERILALLQLLSVDDERYSPAESLIKTYSKK